MWQALTCKIKKYRICPLKSDHKKNFVDFSSVFNITVYGFLKDINLNVSLINHQM